MYSDQLHNGQMYNRTFLQTDSCTKDTCATGQLYNWISVQRVVEKRTFAHPLCGIISSSCKGNCKILCANGHRCLLVQVFIFQLPGCSIIRVFLNVCCTNVLLYKCPFFICPTVQLSNCTNAFLSNLLCTSAHCTHAGVQLSVVQMTVVHLPYNRSIYGTTKLLRQHDDCRSPDTKMTTSHCAIVLT